MRVLTLRGWAVLVAATIVVAAVTMVGVLQVRHWLQDEAQLHEIVGLIQRGQIQIGQPARAPEAPPAAPPPAAK